MALICTVPTGCRGVGVAEVEVCHGRHLHAVEEGGGKDIDTLRHL